MSLRRRNYSSGTRWESKDGYSRAVRFGSFVYVSGTTATNKEHNIVGIGNPYAQTIQIIKNIEIALREVIGHSGSTYWTKKESGKAEIFRKVEPYLTFLNISQLERQGADIQSKHRTRIYNVSASNVT